MARTLDRLASEITERRGDNEKLAIIGIQRRGADLAQRLKDLLDERLGRKIPLGKLDINLYRDDWTNLTRQPSINCTEIPFDIESASIVLVDDVLFPGELYGLLLRLSLTSGDLVGWSCWFWSTVDTGNCLSAQTTWARK